MTGARPARTWGPVLLLVASLAASTEAAASEDLRLTLELARDEYSWGEPIYLSLGLHNGSGQAVEAARWLEPSTGAVEVTVVGPGGNASRFVPLRFLDVLSPAEMLEQGETVTSTVPVFFGARGWVFAERGFYTLFASYEQEDAEGRSLELRSQAATIRVGGDEDPAGEMLLTAPPDASHQAGKFLLWHAGDHLVLGIELLERILERHPETRLADYVRLARGRSLAREFKDYAVGRVRPPDCERAVHYLAAVNRERLPRYLGVLRDLARAQCFAKLRDPQGARGLIAVVKKEVEAPDLQPLADQVVDVEKLLQDR